MPRLVFSVHSFWVSIAIVARFSFGLTWEDLEVDVSCGDAQLAQYLYYLALPHSSLRQSPLPLSFQQFWALLSHLVYVGLRILSRFSLSSTLCTFLLTSRITVNKFVAMVQCVFSRFG